MHTKPLHDWTPLLASTALKEHTGKDVWLKMECNQPSGSFKIRGIGRLCQYWVEHGKTHLVASSAGNAGLAVAYAGRLLGVKVTVFMPSTSKAVYVNAIRAQSAHTKVAGDVVDETHAIALAYTEEVDGAFIHPFDHPLIWSGHATIIDEVAQQNLKPDAIVVAVGGGGLACGILEGLHNYGWTDIPVLTAETQGAASFAASVAAGKLVTLDKIDTLATALGAKRVTERLLTWTKEHPIQPIVVNDKSAVLACQAFANDQRVLVEPSCGAALSVVYDNRSELQAFQSILVIVCGGVGLTTELLAEYMAMVE